MTNTLKKYSIDDLRIGMRVFIEQLSEIYDTWIILTRPHNSELDKKEGYIQYIGSDTNSESDRALCTEDVIIPIYHDSSELDEDMFYEE